MFCQALRKFNIEMNDANFESVMRVLNPSGCKEIDYNAFLQSFGQSIAGAGDTSGLSSQLQHHQDSIQVASRSTSAVLAPSLRSPSYTFFLLS